MNTLYVSTLPSGHNFMYVYCKSQTIIIGIFIFKSSSDVYRWHID